MKLDIKHWRKVNKPHEPKESPQGRLRLRSSVPLAVYIEQTDPLTGEISSGIAAFGAEIALTFNGFVKFWVGDKTADVFVHDPENEVFDSKGCEEIFTCLDKVPYESAQTQAVQQGMRELAYLRQQFQREMRQATLAIQAQTAKAQRAAQSAAVPTPPPPANETAVE